MGMRRNIRKQIARHGGDYAHYFCLTNRLVLAD
jgi:hypothetical protein